MTTNNALLFNATLPGALSAIIKGRHLTAKNTGTPPVIGTADPSYAKLIAQISNLAVEVDSLIPNDHVGAPQPSGTQAISVVTTGVAIVPSTGAIQFGQLMKTLFLEACTNAVVEGRYYGQPGTTLTPSQLASVAQAIATNYLQFTEGLIQPITNPANINNQLILFAAFGAMMGAAQLGTPAPIPNDFFIKMIAACSAFGAAVDQGIPFDDDITAASANGRAAQPVDGPTQLLQLGKVRLMYSIALAAFDQRSPISVALADQNAVAAWAAEIAPAIVAAYKATVGNIAGTLNSPVNNTELWNEAYCGFIAANFAGRPLKSASSTDANYVAVAAAAVEFANAVDAAVGAVDTAGSPVPTGTQGITVAGEGDTTAIVPTTGPIQEGEISKGALIWSICRGTQYGRPLLGNSKDTTQGTYTAIAQSIVALYLNAATAQTTP